MDARVGPLLTALALLSACTDDPGALDTSEETGGETGTETETGAETEATDFDPVLVETLALASADVAEPGDLINEYIAPGQRFVVELYEVPAMPCVRRYGTPPEQLPEDAELPGEPGVFWVAYPNTPAEDGALAWTPHGNSLDFAESLVTYAAKHYPDALELVEIDPASPSGYGSQLTREFAEYSGAFELRTPRGGQFLERGWTVVSPGNCWGDLGLGEGQVMTTELSARRYGKLMDQRTIEWAKQLPYAPGKFFADGCSGGGSRIGQQLQRDPEVFDAASIDSPADDIGGFIEEPWGELIGFAMLIDEAITRTILTNFIVGLGGSLAGIEAHSLGHRLGVDVFVEIPILFGYDVNDYLTPLPVTAALLGALEDPSRYAHPDAMIVEGTIGTHCQFWRDESLHPVRMQWWDERFAD